MRHEKIIRRALQRYWRWQRALTLGARGMVIDDRGAILLVRHTYTPGWTFPGGGVEFGESTAEALRRELAEEANVTLTGPAELFGVYSNANAFPGDHVVLYVVRDWHQATMPKPTREIAGAGFYAPDSLPDAPPAGTRRRIAEVKDGAARSDDW